MQSLGGIFFAESRPTLFAGRIGLSPESESAVAVGAGLVIGKPIGIVLFSWIAVRAGLARLPEGIGWPALIGGGTLAGIGFTMALFVAGLALEGPALEAAKVGILGASAVAAAIGMALLVRALPVPSGAAP